MLAENFMSAEALDLTDEQHAALVKTLRHLETGRADGAFDMGRWWDHSRVKEPGCGTAACIGGWAQFLAGKDVFGEMNCAFGLYDTNAPLCNLMFNSRATREDRERVTDPALGAAALRNYLTTGAARWGEVLAG